ncbi:MAG: sigma-70 family RNA polymerase sigma factor [Chloroflexi bacterium]|nr:sigma-70 family RNA polymerase sigma factor [Chloroflexota bacterium]
MDKQALAEIYDLFSPRLYRYALRLLGSPVVAEECVADTFERLLLAMHRGGGPREYLQAYLYRVAHNWVTDYYRRNPLPELPLDPNLQADHEPSQALVEDMDQQRLRSALGCISPDQRQVIVLKYLEGWQNEQISLAISKSIGAVKALQHRGLISLQKILLDEPAAME